MIRLANRLNIMYYVEEELKHNAQISCLSHRMCGGSIHIDGERKEETIRDEKRMFPFRNVRFEISTKHSNGDVNWAVGCINLQSKKMIWLGYANFRMFTVYLGLRHGIKVEISMNPKECY